MDLANTVDCETDYPSIDHVYYDTDKFTAQLLEEINIEDPRKKEDGEKEKEKDNAQALSSSAVFLASSLMALVHLF